MENLIKQLEKIANQNPDGFTVNLEDMRLVRFGFVASYKETQDSFERHQIEAVIKHAFNHDKIVGGWLNYENGKFYYDSSKVFYSLDEAYKFALANKQMAIFDITNGKQIIIK